MGVVGPNGAGKSTLLKAIFGVLSPWNGHVDLGGDDITTWSPARKLAAGLSLVIQGGRAFPRLSVRDNLLLGGQAILSRSELTERIKAAEEQFPVLGRRRDQQASTLSGGERQQLAIARALVTRPKILLLDEPSLGLSPRLVGEVFGHIARLRDQKIAALIVEQNVEALMKVVDRVTVMSEGSAVAVTEADGFLQNKSMVETFMGAPPSPKGES